MNKMLPIGTVIKVSDNDDKLVIVGKVKIEDEYQYACVVYPYGYVDSNDFIYVKKDDVDTLIFLGDINY